MVFEEKKDFRDTVWQAAEELAKHYKSIPKWDDVRAYMILMERAVTGETYFGTKVPEKH